MVTNDSNPPQPAPDRGGGHSCRPVSADKMLALAERVEALTGPDRLIDAEIACAVKFRNLRPARPDDFDGKFGYSPGNIKVEDGFLMAASYTRSLDDAASLVPDAHDWSLHVDNGEAIAGCMPASPEGCDLANIVGATPALALCAAALRAMASREGER